MAKRERYALYGEIYREKIGPVTLVQVHARLPYVHIIRSRTHTQAHARKPKVLKPLSLITKCLASLQVLEVHLRVSHELLSFLDELSAKCRFVCCCLFCSFGGLVLTLAPVYQIVPHCDSCRSTSRALDE